MGSSGFEQESLPQKNNLELSDDSSIHLRPPRAHVHTCAPTPVDTHNMRNTYSHLDTTMFLTPCQRVAGQLY